MDLLKSAFTNYYIKTDQNSYRRSGEGGTGFLTNCRRSKTSGDVAFCVILAPLNSLNSTPLKRSHLKQKKVNKQKQC